MCYKYRKEKERSCYDPRPYIRVLMLYMRVLILLYTCPYDAIPTFVDTIRPELELRKPLSGSKKQEIPMEMEMSRAVKRRLPIFRTRVPKP